MSKEVSSRVRSTESAEPSLGRAADAIPPSGRLLPLTERLLARLPGRPAVWIAIWALVPWANAGANLLFEDARTSAVWEQSEALVILNYAALSVGVVLALWGAKRIAHRLEALRPGAAELFVGDLRERFRELNSAAGPLVASALTSVAFGLSALLSESWAPALLRGATWFVLGIALWTFLWTYASLQLGLSRLGRARLRPHTASAELGLQLRPFGGIAFTGLWLLLIWLVPVLLTALEDVVGVMIGVLVLAGALATFFLSLLRLHRQMVKAKEGELALARDLYAQAYEPVRQEGTLEALERQRNLLGAADALEKRARDLHDWPIDEGTFARVLTITTSVIAMAVARLILDPLGL